MTKMKLKRRNGSKNLSKNARLTSSRRSPSFAARARRKRREFTGKLSGTKRTHKVQIQLGLNKDLRRREKQNDEVVGSESKNVWVYVGEVK